MEHPARSDRPGPDPRRNIDPFQRSPEAPRLPDVPRLTKQDTEALDLFETMENDTALRLDRALEPGGILVPASRLHAPLEEV